MGAQAAHGSAKNTNAALRAGARFTDVSHVVITTLWPCVTLSHIVCGGEHWDPPPTIGLGEGVYALGPKPDPSATTNPPPPCESNTKVPNLTEQHLPLL